MKEGFLIMNKTTNITECPDFKPLTTGYQDVNDYVALDTETTGLSKTSASIIQFSAVKYVNRKPVDEIDFYVKPCDNKPLDPAITELTGITTEDINNAEPFATHADEIRQWLTNNILVGQNLQFDLTMLASEYHRIGQDLPETKYYDTLQLAHQLVPYLTEPGAYKLENLKDILPPSDVKDLTNHNSLNDTKMTGAIFNFLTGNPDVTKQNYDALVKKADPFQVKEFTLANRAVTRLAGKIDGEPFILYQINDLKGCVINSLVCGHWLNKNDIEHLLLNGYIESDQFISHANRPFTGKLILDENNQLVFDFPKNYLVDNFDVQIEQRDGISKFGKSYRMFTLYGHDVDKAVIFDDFMKHKFNTEELTALANGDTILLENLISKTGKKFDSKVTIDQNRLKLV